MFRVALVFAVLAGSAVAADSPEVRAVKVDRVHALRFKQLAREAENKAFLAKMEEGNAELALKRAEGVYQRAKDVGGASSAREKTLALIEVIAKKFDSKRAAYHVYEADKLAESWRDQAKWALTGTENPVALAKTNRELREKRVEILATLVLELPEFLKLMDGEFAAVTRLLQNVAASRDEFERIELLTKGAHALEKLAIDELAAARRHVDEATADETMAAAPILEVAAPKK